MAAYFGQEHRQDDFKHQGKTHEVCRTKRRESNVELRKKKRFDAALKKRNLAGEASEDSTPLSVFSNFTAQHSVQKLELDVSLEQMVHRMNAGTAEEQFHAVERCRKLLSETQEPPIQAVIDAKVVPALVQLIQRDHPETQIEAAWALSNIAAGSHLQTLEVIKSDAVPITIQLLQSPHSSVKEHALFTLGNIAGDGPEARDFIIQHNGIENILHLLQNDFDSLSVVRRAAWALSNLCRAWKTPPSRARTDLALPVLKTQLIDTQDVETLIELCWATSHLAEGHAERVGAVLDAGLGKPLVSMLEHDSTAVLTPALRAVGNIVSGAHAHTEQICNLGALPALRRLLSSTDASIVKETCFAISNIAAGTHSQVGAVIEHNLLPSVIGIARSAEYRARREACWVIANICNSGLPAQVLATAEMGGLLALVDGLAMMEPQALDAYLRGIEQGLMIGRQNGRDFAQDIEETNQGLSAIEHLLQSHEATLATRAEHIIATYFDHDDDEESESNLGLADVGQMQVAGMATANTHTPFGAQATVAAQPNRPAGATGAFDTHDTFGGAGFGATGPAELM